jgi:signal transduction histidine kinase
MSAEWCPRILIIDDNPAIHTDFRKILCQASPDVSGLGAAEAELFEDGPAQTSAPDFAVDCASQGQEGLRLVQRALAEGRPYAMAFVDVRMPPGWDGVETIKRIWEIDPDLHAVICTAYSDFSWSEVIDRLGRCDRLVVLKKPFDNVEALQLAYALSEKWRLGQQIRHQIENLDRLVNARTHELLQANGRLKDEMESRAQTEARLRHTQKMEAVGQLAAGVAHDFNNLLSILLCHTEQLRDCAGREAGSQHALQQITQAAKRAATLTRQLLSFSRKEVVRKAAVDLTSVVQETLTMLGRILGEDIKVTMHSPPIHLPPIKADKGMLDQIIVNLAVNARDAMPKGGSLVIQTESCEIDESYVQRHPQARPGLYVCLLVTDSGCGMDAATLERIFEPFFTTKELGKGSGLGLAAVYGIVQQHEGWIEVTSQKEVGTTFKIFFPACPQVPLGKSSETTPPFAQGGSETILVVEDEIALRDLVSQVLRDYGYRVLQASNGKEAIDVWKSCQEQIHLLLTDIVMPGGLSGWELAKELNDLDTKLKVVFTSGYNDELSSGDEPRRTRGVFLPKPCHPRKLAQIVRASLDA